VGTRFIPPLNQIYPTRDGNQICPTRGGNQIYPTNPLAIPGNRI
jgi:hypothetical protein